jgi:hypothetical protein
LPACPACGTEAPPSAQECPRCHLAVHLFDPVREAIGLPESDPRYASEIRELLKAVDPSGTPPTAPGPSGPGEFAYPARFPAPRAPRIPVPDGPTPPALETLPALPALPGGGAAGLRRQIDEYLDLSRRQGLELGGITLRTKEAILVDDPGSLERLSRDLFVRLAAALAEEYEQAAAKRNGLSTLVSTVSQDRALKECHDALLRGDLAGTQPRLRAVHDELTALEDQWATVQILIAESDLVAETIRELGGDPGPALGPLEEGRRIAREGDRNAAEPVLAKAALALWAVCDPKFSLELRRIKDRLLAQRSAGMDVSRSVEQFRELTHLLSRRNFGATIACYRRLRDLVAAADTAPSSAGGSGSPSAPVVPASSK